MKKILSLVLVLAMAVTMCLGLISCSPATGDKESDKETTADSNKTDLKVGVLLVGDETEGYTLAHMNGIMAAVEAVADKLGKTVSISYKKFVPEDADCAAQAKALIGDGCTLIISNSYGHQDYMAEVAEQYPNVAFVAMTGDFASISGCANLYNAFTDVYEARFVSGVVAGLKLRELIDAGKIDESFNMADGNYKIGYVGAFNYAEVVSGYTAFYLGLKSVVSNVQMEVVYTDSWFSEPLEAAAAEKLMANGCVIIGQHADSTGAPTAVQAQHDAGKYTNVYCVGYNVDMIDNAPDVILTSSTNNWEVYYETLFTAVLNGEDIPQDWSEGYHSDAVGITALNEKTVAAGTADKVAEVVANIKSGAVRVFDTSTFKRADGSDVTEATFDFSYRDWANGGAVIYQGETKDMLKTDSATGITYFDESSFRAAPYFDIRIAGIVEDSERVTTD